MTVSAGRASGDGGHGEKRIPPDSPLPPAPPPEALAAVGAAARLSSMLVGSGCELRFGAGRGGSPIELRSAEGRLLRTFTASEALDWITDL